MWAVEVADLYLSLDRAITSYDGLMERIWSSNLHYGLPLMLNEHHPTLSRVTYLPCWLLRYQYFCTIANVPGNYHKRDIYSTVYPIYPSAANN